MAKRAGGGWQSNLLRGKGYTDDKGKFHPGPIKGTIGNVVLILANDPVWSKILVFDEMRGSSMTLKVPPWPPSVRQKSGEAGPWTDADTTRLVTWLEQSPYKVCALPNAVADAVAVASRRNLVHPVRDWLNSLKWDGVKRLDTWLADLVGADDTPYTRIAGAKFLISAVARAMEPGCKVDHTLVFEGKQGAGKSSFLRTLCGAEWFMETTFEMGTLDSYQTLRGKWIVELAELDSLGRSEMSRAKAYLTAQIDTFRPSYGRHAVNLPRMIVFVGTVNGNEYLKDDSGGRRFWPVTVGEIQHKKLAKAREQLWAEATHRYKAGEPWYVKDKKVEELFTREQEDRRQQDPWTIEIARLIGRHPGWRQTGVSCSDILNELGIETSRRGRYDEMRVGSIFRSIGWNRTRVRVYGSLAYVYRPDDAA